MQGQGVSVCYLGCLENNNVDKIVINCCCLLGKRDQGGEISSHLEDFLWTHKTQEDYLFEKGILSHDICKHSFDSKVYKVHKKS